jgi:6-phosphogluconate dehydrogenase
VIDVAAQVLAARDPEGNPLVEMILDQAGQQGAGKWTVESALELGVPIPTIAAAIVGRMMSGMKGERLTASTLLARATTGRVTSDGRATVAVIHDALPGAMVCAYAQGMSLLRTASVEYGWGVDLREIARIWKGGCIFRERLLDTLTHAFERAPELPNLLLDADVRPWLSEAERGWGSTVSAEVAAGIPVPVMTAALAYFEGIATRGCRRTSTRHSVTSSARTRISGPRHPTPPSVRWRRAPRRARCIINKSGDAFL